MPLERLLYMLLLGFFPVHSFLLVLRSMRKHLQLHRTDYGIRTTILPRNPTHERFHIEGLYCQREVWWKICNKYSFVNVAEILPSPSFP